MITHIKKKLKLTMESRTNIRNILRFPKDWIEQVIGDGQKEVEGNFFPGMRAIVICFSKDEEEAIISRIKSLDDLEIDPSYIGTLERLEKQKIKNEKIHRESIKNSALVQRINNERIPGRDHVTYDLKHQKIFFEPYQFSAENAGKLVGLYGLKWNFNGASPYYPLSTILIEGRPADNDSNIFTRSIMEEERAKHYNSIPISISDIYFFRSLVDNMIDEEIQRFLDFKENIENFAREFKMKIIWDGITPSVLVNGNSIKLSDLPKNRRLWKNEYRDSYNKLRRGSGSIYLYKEIYGIKFHRDVDSWWSSQVIITLNEMDRPDIIPLIPPFSKEEAQFKLENVIAYLKALPREKLKWTDKVPPMFEDRLRKELDRDFGYARIICPNCKMDITKNIYYQSQILSSYLCYCGNFLGLAFENDDYCIRFQIKDFPNTKIDTSKIKKDVEKFISSLVYEDIYDKSENWKSILMINQDLEVKLKEKQDRRTGFNYQVFDSEDLIVLYDFDLFSKGLYSRRKTNIKEISKELRGRRLLEVFNKEEVMDCINERICFLEILLAKDSLNIIKSFDVFLGGDSSKASYITLEKLDNEIFEKNKDLFLKRNIELSLDDEDLEEYHNDLKSYISEFIVKNHHYQFRFNEKENLWCLYRISDDTEIDEWKCDLYRLLYQTLRKYCDLLEIDYFINPEDFLLYIKKHSRKIQSIE